MRVGKDGWRAGAIADVANLPKQHRASDRSNHKHERRAISAFPEVDGHQADEEERACQEKVWSVRDSRSRKLKRGDCDDANHRGGDSCQEGLKAFVLHDTFKSLIEDH